jgi:hypothetical protein
VRLQQHLPLLQHTFLAQALSLAQGLKAYERLVLQVALQ